MKTRPFLAEFDVSDMTAVSIEDEKVSYSGITLYPNPANQAITILPDNETAPYETTVFDISGKVVLNKLCEGGGRQTLNLLSIPSGIYLIRVESEGSSYHAKFVKL